MAGRLFMGDHLVELMDNCDKGDTGMAEFIGAKTCGICDSNN
jgi:hypothetical protein